MIEVENLTYVYPGASAPAVSDVSFTVERGRIFGLLGPSGAGKSTTQRVLTRQNRRFRGSVSVLSRRVESWDHTFYEHIGVGFELPNHYLRLTGRENLEFFASLYAGPTRAAGELLEAVGLGDAADERVSEYSKGMKMRLNFVRAILHDPEVLFLDEPTARYGQRRVRVEYVSDAGAVKTADFALDRLAQNREFLELLDARPIRSIHSREASLNRVFADVTGVRLVEGAAG